MKYIGIMLFILLAGLLICGMIVDFYYFNKLWDAKDLKEIGEV